MHAACPWSTVGAYSMRQVRQVRLMLTAILGLVLLSALLPGCIPSSDSPAPTNSAANLATMDVAVGPLAPAFNPEITNYEVAAPSGAASTTITASPADTRATLQVNNQPATAGQPFGPITLDVGTNPVTVLVDAPGAVKSYLVMVTRGDPADLFDLEVSAAPLSPDFAPATTSYAVSTPTTTTQTTVTATLSDPRATLRINNQAAVSGQPFGPLALAAGTNTISVVATAVTGATKTYTVLVNRAGPGNANLAALAVSAGALSPAFSANTVTYTVTTPSTTTSTTVTAQVADPTSTLTINGQAAVSGQAFGPIPLNPTGQTTTVAVTVRAQDGVTLKTYTVQVVRGASANATLSALSLTAGPLKPSFSPSRTSYTVDAPSSTKSTMVTATTADPSATLKINGAAAVSGQPFGPIALVNKKTRITIEVRAQNGTTKSYRVEVER